jgi:putative membrane protein (TIGR04086 family)
MQKNSFAALRPSWIAFGWFIGAAVSALILLALVAVGLMSPDTTRDENVWIALALLIGFGVGGLFVGLRTRAAPVLHGIAIGLFSLVVWLLANLLMGEPTGWTAWRALPTVQALALIGLQTASAVVGARIGVRWTATLD